MQHEKKSSKNHLKIGFGRVFLGSIWEGFGTVWGVFWALLDDFCSSFDVQNQAFVKHGPRWAPRGLLDRFWEGLGRIWGGIQKSLGNELRGFGGFLCKLWADSGHI